MGPALTYAGAAILALLGVLHLIYTIRDFGPRPRYFRPSRADLVAMMQQSRTALAPQGRDYWSGILGFHLSHAFGILMLALFGACLANASLSVIRVIVSASPLVYAAISHRCWFRTPTLGAGLAGILWVTALAFA